MKALILTIAVFLVFMHANAQQNLVMFFMHDDPHTNLLNPAIQAPCKLMVGIPVLSSTQLNFNSTGFSYHDLGKTKIDFANLKKKSHIVDFLSFELHLNLISLGYKWKQYYFNFNLSEKVETKIFYPGSLIELFDEGNYPGRGKKVKFGSLGANLIHYREYAFGVSKEMDEGFFLGGKLKLLFGKANVQTRREQSFLYTDAETYNLELETNLRINASAPIEVTKDATGEVTDFGAGNINPVSYLLNRRNWGLAADLGGIYPMNEDISLEASLLDFGFIRWAKDAHEFTQHGNVKFAGVNTSPDFEPGDYLNDIIDSANNQLKIFESGDPYFIMLNPKLNLGASYKINENLFAGALWRTEFYPRRPITAFSLSIHTRRLKYLNASLAYNIVNASYNAVGAGLTTTLGAFQMHLVSDNLTAIFKPAKTRNVNLRFGFNLNFGCGKKAKAKKWGKADTGCGCGWVKDSNRAYKKR